MKRSIFNLALDFYQSPAEHRDLLDPATPLPPDVCSLIDALAEGRDPGAEQAVELPADLRAAIQYLIERVFFAPGADCYRVLGLNIGAKAEEIRKHYQQLLHIFALDRADRAGEWNTTFATQINRAYSVLRDPERRRAYDQSLLQPGGQGEAGRAREGRPADHAEAARSPGKVSYLSANTPAARPLTPEQEIQELHRQLPQEAAGPAERAVQPDRPAPGSTPKSSFVAHRIDRASGISEQQAVTAGHASWAPAIEPLGGSHQQFPKGIPVTELEPEALKDRRILSMNRSSLALAVAVILVLAVYAIVLPGRFSGESGPGPEPAVEALAEKSNGDVLREGSVPPDDADDQAIAGVDSGAALPGRQSEAAAPAPASPRVDRQPLAAVPAAGPAASLGGDDVGLRDATASPGAATLSRPDRGAVGPVVADAPGATSPAKDMTGSSAGSEGVTPARKLESLRQTLQEETASAPATAQPPAPKAGVVAAQRTDATAAPARAETRQAAPAGDGMRSETSAAAVVAQVQPVVRPAAQPPRNGATISIQELDRLAETFSRAYEAGDLDLLVSLFSENARTNDQSSRAGIAKDYQDLFQVSEKRRFVINRLRWERDRNGSGLKGEGDFHVDVQLKSDHSVTSVQGKVIFHVERGPDGVVITEMLHTYN